MAGAKVEIVRMPDGTSEIVNNADIEFAEGDLAVFVNRFYAETIRVTWLDALAAHPEIRKRVLAQMGAKKLNASEGSWIIVPPKVGPLPNGKEGQDE